MKKAILPLVLALFFFAFNVQAFDLSDKSASAAITAPVQPATNNILYVDINVSGGNGSGSSWANAIPQLANALKWARGQWGNDGNGAGWNAANPLKIYVAKGTYKPMYNAADGSYTTDGGRNNAFVMVPNTKLYGGFDPASGITDLSDQRTIPTPENETFTGGSILSGNIGAPNLNTDNTYHVVITAGAAINNNFLMDGFVLTSGYGNSAATITVNGQTISQRSGGGWANIDGSPRANHLLIKDNAVVGSTAGAGWYIQGGSPELSNSIINSNHRLGASSYAGGGGIAVNGIAHPKVINTVISGNTSQASGGGLLISGGNIVLTNVVISGNTATDKGGGIYYTQSSATLTNVSISGNVASSGGAIALSSATGTFNINNSIIWGNSSGINKRGFFQDVTVNVNYSIIRGGHSGAGNLDTDPLFVNAPNHAGAPFTSGNYRLQSGSPAIDNGSNSAYPGSLNADSDLAGNPRLYGSAIDMGAYELQGITPGDPDNFITTWKTTSANESITIPINPNRNGYNYTVNWGDGNTSTGQTGDATHTYATAGTYTVSITGDFPAIQFSSDASNAANDLKLLTIKQWGTQVWEGMDKAFMGCKNLIKESGRDAPVFAPHSTLYSMFSGCSSFNSNLNNWDLTNVRETSFMFNGASDFNGKIWKWNVSNVTNMQSMFMGAEKFNRDISEWNTANVKLMDHMFHDAQSFNQDIGDWNVSSVKNMIAMFLGAVKFNQNLNNWKVSNVTNMIAMFYKASAFNRNLCNWDVSGVTDMTDMLSNSGLSGTNYDATLMGWAAQNVQSNIELGADGLIYCDGDSARRSLIRNHDWTISGDRNSCLVAAQPDGNGIVYVDSAIATPGNGSSWSQALQYLSNATESARTNTAIKEIHVAKGTYYPTGLQNATYRDSSFMITRGGLKLIGGYPNGGGPRSLSGAEGSGANETILSGDINAVADTADNSLHVMMILMEQPLTDSLIVDGFTLTLGNAHEMSSTRLGFVGGLGGGMIIFGTSSNTIAIRNCLFSKNYAFAGGGMLVMGSISGSGASMTDLAPYISNCIFKENAAVVQNVNGTSIVPLLGGGGMMNIASSPVIDHCVFIENTAKGGGAILNYARAEAIVKNTIITKNSAQAFSAGVSFFQSGLTFINCLITENITDGSALNMPETVSLNGTVLGSILSSNLRLINSTFSRNISVNTANTTGNSIVAVQDSKSLITNSLIWGNQFNGLLDSLNKNTINSASVIAYSLVQGMAANAQNHTLDGTINQDLFKNAANGNYQLRPTSPAINAGINDSLLNALPPGSATLLDLAGNARIYGFANGGIADLGAYEYQGNPIIPGDPGNFITTWKTNNKGTSSNKQITIPTRGGGYNYDVYWEKVNNSSQNGTIANATGDLTITFPTKGTYRVEITGDFPRIYFNNEGDKLKILAVEQWGNIQWTNMASAFRGAENLTAHATDAPDLSGVTSLANMFYGCASMNGSIGNWDVAHVTNMYGMFYGASSFNRNLNTWNVSNVTNMATMFQGATGFNGIISGWDVGNVTNMRAMFNSATAFNQNLTKWNVSNVTNMASMFSNATSFNGIISKWKVNNVTNMASMFYRARAFNQNLKKWTVSNVTDMSSMFQDAGSFNGNISNWDVANVTDMAKLFSGASAFDRDLGAWDVSAVTDMSEMLFNSGLSLENYDSTLIGWAAQNVQTGVALGAKELIYCAAIGERQSLIDDYGWSISGDNKAPHCKDITAFITTWKTTTANESITIPVHPGKSAYDYAVDWGDGNVSTSRTGDATHTYATAGIYTVSITGDFPAIKFSSPSSDDANDAKLLTVEQWGTQVWDGMDAAFSGCKNLTTVSSTDVPIFAPNSSLYGMFYKCASFNSDLNNWDLANVNRTHYMFFGASSFNGIISGWNVSNVTNMSGMFHGAESFNQNLNKWDVRKVTNMLQMFNGASNFNGNIGNWDVSGVTNMGGMFNGAAAFNKGLKKWDVSNVTNMRGMFDGASNFNGNIGNWDVSKVSNMVNMFRGASAFNRNLGNWNVSGVTNMAQMLSNSGLSLENYDATLIGWAAQNVQSGVALGANGLTYCTATEERQSLIDHQGWTISGDRQRCPVIVHPDANGILYVDSAVATPGDGSSWAKALQSFGDAISGGKNINENASSPADSLRQIWVANGTYQPEQDSSFFMLPHVKIYGSFVGTESSLAQRPSLGVGIAQEVTSILKGNGNSVIRNDNNGLNTSALLDGFKVTGGMADGSDEDAKGGGIYNYKASPTLSHLTISGNMADYQGGGVYNFRSSPVLTHVILSENKAHSEGGGGLFNQHSSPVLTNVIISGNSAYTGGGMKNKYFSSPVLTNVIITGNTAIRSGGGMLNNSISNPVLINVTISGNTANVNTFGSGGGMYNINTAAPILINSIVWGNDANDKGNEITNNPSCSITLHHSLYGNGANDIVGDGLTTDHSITVAPMFIDTANGNYQLQASSPAINAGTNDSIPAWDSTDIAGNSRIYNKANGGIVDMGAYEFQGNTDSIEILKQPLDITVCTGADTAFTIEATGSNLTYQWQSSDDGNTWNNTNNGTTETLELSNVTAADSGMQYRVILTGDWDKDTSASATLSVRPKTTLTTQPTDITVSEGGDASFSVVATGTNLNYQWKSSIDGTTWNNATNGKTETLELSNVGTNLDSTQYLVIVSGNCGMIVSDTVMLTVIANPVITLSPDTLTKAGIGQFYKDSVTASGGTNPYSYQLTGQLPVGIIFNSTTGEFSGTPTEAGIFNISIQATGVNNFSGNNSYSLKVDTPQLALQPGALNPAYTGMSYSTTFEASGGTKPYTYTLSGDALPSGLHFVNGLLSGKPITSGDYNIEITATGSSTGTGASFSVSRQYHLNILNAGSCMTVSSWPSDQIACGGNDATFTVKGIGIDSYQWQTKSIKSNNWHNLSDAAYTLPDGEIIKPAQNVSGSTSATLTIDSVTAAQSGMQYRVVLGSNGCGSLISGSATLSVQEHAAITAQPTNQTICVSTNVESEAIFSVSATGTNLSYQWQSSVDGISWNNVTGETYEILKLSNIGISQSGTSYRVIVSGTCNKDTSGIVMLTVNPIKHTMLNEVICFGSSYNFGGKNISQSGTYSDTLQAATGCDSIVVLHLKMNANAMITSQPSGMTANIGGGATFSVAASGTITTYQWQYSGDGGTTWNKVSNGTAETLKLSNIQTGLNGFKYRAIVKGACNNDTSNAARLMVHIPITWGAPDDTLSPGYEDVPYADSVTASDGTDSTPTYKETGPLPPGVTFNPENGQLSGTPTDTGSYPITITVTFPAGNTDTTYSKSKDYTIVVESNGACIQIAQQPQDKTACEGGKAIFSITASNATAYQWQNSTNGTTWNNVMGETDETLKLSNLGINQNGTLYRVIVSSACGNATSNAAILTVNAIKHTTLNKTICFGDSYYFNGKNISQSGTYVDSLSTFTGCDSIVVLNLTIRLEIKTILNETICEGQSYTIGTNKYTTTGTYQDTLRSYTGCDSVVVLHLMVNAQTSIATQPKKQTVCSGGDVSFSVSATGINLKYQWQNSTDGITWNNVTNGTSETLKLSNLETALNGTQYRVVVTGACETKTSNPVTLTVNALPEITIVADSTNPVSKGLPVHLTASLSAGQAGGADSYRWANSPGIQSGWSASMLTIRPMQDATYTVTGTTAAGCTATQSYDVTIIVDYKLICNNIVSPNGDGKNDRWIIQNIAAYPINEVMIFDRAGRMIYQKKGYNNRWDATVVGRPIHEGTYYYVFKVDGGKIFKGFIEVLRERR